MSLTTNGVWAANVWASTVWGDCVWYENHCVVAPVAETPRPTAVGGGKLTREDREHIRSEIERMYAFLTGELEIPKEEQEEVKAEAVEIVRPFTKSKANKPRKTSVRWGDMAKRVEAVERLAKLYKKIQEIELEKQNQEAIVLLLLH